MFGRGKRETSGTIVPGSYSVSNPIARKFLALDNATLGHLECLKPIIEGNLDPIANEFYRRLTDVPEVEAFIKQHSTVERLKVTLKQLLQKLYVTNITPEYMAHMHRVGEVHNRIKLPADWFILACGALRHVLVPHIVRAYGRDTTKLTLVLQALDQIMQLIEAEVNQSFIESFAKELDKKEELEALMEEQTALVRKVQDSSQTLAATAEETTASASQMAHASVQIMDASEHAKNAAEEARASAGEGERLSRETLAQVQAMVASNQEAQEKVASLEATSQAVGNIVETITGIAGQTNLLALNAAIEAARAGEAGRGFAVVAEEVRKLAEQSRSAANEIVELIQRNNASTGEVVSSMAQQAETMNRVGAAVNETSGRMTHIMESIANNYKQVEHINTAVASLVETSHEIEKASDEVAGAATDLSAMVVK